MNLQQNVNKTLQNTLMVTMGNSLKDKFTYKPVSNEVKEMTTQRINDIKQFKTAQQLGIKKDKLYTADLMKEAAKKKAGFTNGKE